ncbi:MAG: BrnT family toxin [Magnetococcales bacterium]|nr:BrnT family toxin [Magnetococcales bacterium]
MKIAFDPAKDATNRLKHGESLAAAEGLDWEEAIAFLDQRCDYGETRMIGYAPKSGRLYCVVFMDRGDARRIISLRKANSREVRISMSKRGLSLQIPTPDEDAAIARGVEVDSDTYEPTDEEIMAMRPVRGRPVNPGRKVLLSVRYSRDVVEFFRAMGPGWQTRMNDVLQEWVASHR